MSPVMRRVVAAFGAHSYGQAVSVVTQLASLPLFLGRWDTTTYGIWLMLTAMPTYLSMSDGGLVTAAANEIAVASAKNDTQRANRLFQSSLAFLTGTCTVVALIAAFAIYVVGIPGVKDAGSQNALMLLAIGVLIAQFNGLAETIYRASGHHALGIFLGNNSRLAEWAGWMVGLFAFGTYQGVAATGLLCRALGFACTWFGSTRIQSDIRWRFQLASKNQVRALVGPAASFMTFTLSNALSIQGITLLVGHLLGPVAVAIFNTYRTISRVALLITSTLGNSVWAEFSRLYATGGMPAVAPLFLRAYRISTAASVGLSLVLLVIAPFLLKYWSRNQIDFQFGLMALMLAYAAVAGSWNVARVLLMSINNHTNLARLAMGGALAALAISFPLGAIFGLIGIAMALILIETAMAIACTRAAQHQLGQEKK